MDNINIVIVELNNKPQRIVPLLCDAVGSSFAILSYIHSQGFTRDQYSVLYRGTISDLPSQFKDIRVIDCITC